MVASSSESSEPKYSDDYEEIPEDAVCDCDDQPEETEQRNNLTDDKNGTCEDVCLSSSTYYIACRGGCIHIHTSLVRHQDSNTTKSSKIIIITIIK